MKPIDFNKYSSAIKQRLRDVLGRHETAYAFMTSKDYSHTLKVTLESLRIQEEQFEEFVIRKQKEIDAMDAGIIKSKMQEHLDKIAVQTYEHFSQLTAKYLRMLKRADGEGTIFNYTQN
jgi:hypothetical protein